MSSPPVPASEPRAIPSDATLVWLASERTAPLFRTLDRTRAFSPLVVLLSVLPPVLATFAEVVTPEDAAWGLRALDATGSPLPPQVADAVARIVPGEKVRSAALWLSAFLLRLADPARPVSASLASLLGGAVLLSLLWPLSKSLGGRRFAFWAVLIAAFHPTLVTLLLEPVPIAVSLSLAVTAVWGHLNLGGRPLNVLLSVVAIVAAVAAGLLLTGPAALAVPILIAADAVLALLLPVRGTSDQRISRGAAGAGTIALWRIASAVIGTVLWLLLEQIVPDITTIVPARLPSAGSETFAIEQGDLSMDVIVVGPLWGLAVIGFGRLLRSLTRRGTSRSMWPAPRLLLVWIVAGASAILWMSRSGDGGFNPVGQYVTALFALPLLLTAAYAIEEASRRMISGAWVLLAIALPLAVRLGGLMATLPSDSIGVWALLAAIGLAVAWVIAKVIPAIMPQTGLRRGALMAAVLVAIAVNSADGLAVLFRPHRDDEAYRHLVRALEPMRDADAVVLLTSFSPLPPPDLVYAVRASFPDATMEVASSWDEAASRLDRRSPQKIAVAVWGMREGVGAASAEELRPAGEPLLFDGRELLLYSSDSEPQSAF